MKRENRMHAIAINQFGGRGELKWMELPVPVAGPGEVLIQIKAAGVNPVDWKIREGLLRFRLPHQFPIIPGWDAAGTIVGTGEAVYAYCRKPIVKDGTYTEYVAVPRSNVAPKPKTLSFIEAASVPLAALTAYQSLFDAAGLKRGQTVLIHAAGGGVGGFAVQLAKLAGARVIATASKGKHDYVKSLGADEVIDHRAVDFRRVVRDVDVAFDTVGGETQQHSAEVVRRGGVLVSILALENAEAIRKRGVEPKYVFVRPNAAQLRRLTTWLEAGKLRTTIAKVFPLRDAAKAHALIERGHVTGKIVLEV